MPNLSHCPNCNTKLNSLLSSYKLLGENLLKFAKDFGGFEGEALCEKCSREILQKAKVAYKSLNLHIQRVLNEYLSSFPIVSIQNPQNWRYKTLSIVTAQATMENKVETSSFDKLFGINQNTVDLNSSANIGEQKCFKVLRQKAYLLGGNAIIGVDIDYSEFGTKGELMLICVAGTAVKLENLELFSAYYVKSKEKHDKHKQTIDLIIEHSETESKIPTMIAYQ